MNFQEFKIKGYKGKEKKVKSAGLMYRLQRKISIRISWVLLKIFPGITANYVSTTNIALLFFILFLSIFLNKDNAFLIVLLQLFLLNMTSVLDKVDGEIARCQEHITQRGIYYDITYHFFYPFISCFSAGYFFYILTDNIFVLFGVLFLGILQTNNIFLGKIRNYIKVKILLEGHQEKIRDYLKERKKRKRQLLPLRLVNYFVFLIYDWVWCLYVLLVFLAYINFSAAFYIFVIYLVLSISMMVYKAIVSYPKADLFTKDDLR